MIGHLRGTLLTSTPGHVLIDCHGVGYEVTVSMTTFAELPEAGHETALFVFTNVREDQIALYGFASADEKALFERLVKVSGVGPRVALGVLGGMSLRELVAAIRGGDAARLTRMPGVGKKTAERIVLELKNKLDEFGIAAAAPKQRRPVEEDVLSALINLGYQSSAAEQALEKLGPAAGRGFEPLFRAALAQLAR